jgi:hypothetical protein
LAEGHLSMLRYQHGLLVIDHFARDIIWEIQHQFTSGNLLEQKPGFTQRKITRHPQLSVCYFE